MAIRRLLGDVLDIAEVLPFGDPAAPDDVVTFEWVGLVDHLGERRGKSLSRGAQMTSADAAIRYRTPTGAIEIALVEWKFTERYSGRPVPTASRSNLRRIATYLPLSGVHPQSPLNDVLGVEHRLIEPLCQLGRQQLLAWRMEVAGELDASRVLVVEAAPTANELWASVPEALGDDLRAIWPEALRRPDRWVYLDTARWLDPSSPVSDEFRTRYAALTAAP